MKIGRKIIYLLLILPVFCLFGCQEEKNYDEKAKVVFELEGGVFQNCTLPIVHYYELEDNEQKLIQEPMKLTSSPVERAGYTFVGWYKTKTENNGVVTYADEWDFGSDQINQNGITLYAKWKKDVKYTYSVCYYDNNNQLNVLGNYDVSEGDEFDDYANYAKKRYGFTAIDFYDEAGNLWDNDFKHPGGESDLAVKVIVKYIEGNYSVVRTVNDLKKSKNQNIYLANDLDLNGEKFNFDDYKGIFLGNGHTISNFSINYRPDISGLIDDFENNTQKSLAISIFGNIDGATIQDVTFKNVTVDVNTTFTRTYKIYVAPICVSAKNATIKNVVVEGNFTYSQLPSNFDVTENLYFVTDKVYYIKDEVTVVENTTVNISNENNN